MVERGFGDRGGRESERVDEVRDDDDDDGHSSEQLGGRDTGEYFSCPEEGEKAEKEEKRRNTMSDSVARGVVADCRLHWSRGARRGKEKRSQRRGNRQTPTGRLS